jgi:hypothetical protein
MRVAGISVACHAFFLFQGRAEFFHLPAESLPSEHPRGLLDHIAFIEQTINFQMMVEFLNKHAHHAMLRF